MFVQMTDPALICDCRSALEIYQFLFTVDLTNQLKCTPIYLLVFAFIMSSLIFNWFFFFVCSLPAAKSFRQKLLTMLPTKEEKSRIQEAQAANPDLPLGSAEQFLLTLTSISELPARLKLWAFKLDFENSEKVSKNLNSMRTYISSS